MRLLRPLALAAALLAAMPAAAADPGAVVRDWYRLVLELVRHTPTYSPPVASRSFAYLGIVAFEAQAQADPRLVSLAGQVHGLTPLPPRAEGVHDEAVVVNAALTAAVEALFANTGPTGQRAMAAMSEAMAARVAEGVAGDVRARSEAAGRAVAAHVLDWAATDGGAEIDNLGFPREWPEAVEPSDWVPTSTLALWQTPLLPGWGKNRTFAVPEATTCPLAPHPEYSEDPASAFYAEVKEVYDVSKSLTDDQRAIASFWSDDPMLSPTPPGHWISIAMQLLDEEGADAARTAQVLARLGIALADAFIACWEDKYDYFLLRPVTYIRRHIDPEWETYLITPPFPEYPSGHSVQSGAAEIALAAEFGADVAFTDATHEDDGMTPRHYANFHEAAEEAGFSRLYGGIHYRSAIVNGLEQGRCVGRHAAALKMRADP